ncbi:MAG: hypothetical protein AAB797_01270 [Patescibacteria group bacterium]
MYALFWLVVVGAVIVWYRVYLVAYGKQKPDKPQQPDDFSDLLVIERVSGEYQAETESQVIKRAHSDLLTAGDAVLAKLSDSARQTLSAPISAELKSRVSQGDIPDNLTPQRVRSAVAVAEISITLESLMVQFLHNRTTDPLFLILFFVNGTLTEINIGGNKIRASHIIDSFAGKIEVNEFYGYVAACGIWDAVVALLREDKVRIPGLRAKAAVAMVK